MFKIFFDLFKESEKLDLECSPNRWMEQENSVKNCIAARSNMLQNCEILAAKYWSILVKLIVYLISKDTSGFTSNTLLIRFPIMLLVYIVYWMHKVEWRMVKKNYMNTQGDKIKAILL